MLLVQLILRLLNQVLCILAAIASCVFIIIIIVILKPHHIKLYNCVAYSGLSRYPPEVNTHTIHGICWTVSQAIRHPCTHTHTHTHAHTLESHLQLNLLQYLDECISNGSVAVDKDGLLLFTEVMFHYTDLNDSLYYTCRMLTLSFINMRHLQEERQGSNSAHQCILDIFSQRMSQ